MSAGRTRLGFPLRGRRRRFLATAGLGALTAAGLAGCGTTAGEPRHLSEAPIPVQPAPTPTPARFPPVRLPEDEAPHDVLTEWWYYTGHLYEGTDEYGFELVMFRGIRGDRPPGYAAHFAVTDLPRQRFRYDQRADVALNEAPVPATAPPGGAAPDGSRPPGVVAVTPAGGGFDLALGDWRMRGRDGQDWLSAAMPGYRLEAALTALRPPALHEGEPPVSPGLISFGPAGYSYYYSRTRMSVDGILEVEGAPRAVHGEAWMDHQWGDFLVLGGGGWDWFAANLRDGRDVTISVVRDDRGTVVMTSGTLVEASGETRHLSAGSLSLEPTGRWTSPHTGVTYPSGWRLRLPEASLDVLWTPLLADQELDTRPSTGVVYWEGAVGLQDASSGADLGRGYVELTGYGAPQTGPSSAPAIRPGTAR
jgi:predicted secreted hydrolase